MHFVKRFCFSTFVTVSCIYYHILTISFTNTGKTTRQDFLQTLLRSFIRPRRNSFSKFIEMDPDDGEPKGPNFGRSCKDPNSHPDENEGITMARQAADRQSAAYQYYSYIKFQVYYSLMYYCSITWSDCFHLWKLAPRH